MMHPSSLSMPLVLAHEHCVLCQRRIGMRMGFTMRQQLVAAIHSKVLRLNSAAVVHANSGLVVNLVSNDVRR
jgi:hypothetical protein